MLQILCFFFYSLSKGLLISLMQQKIGCAKSDILCVILPGAKQKHSAEAWSYGIFLY